jgi:hypothetical protein
MTTTENESISLSVLKETTKKVVYLLDRYIRFTYILNSVSC